MSTVDVDLDITGMTRTSCATRVERKLNKLPGGIRMRRFRPLPDPPPAVRTARRDTTPIHA